MAATKFCAWVDAAVDLRVLRVRATDGEERTVFRKVSDNGFGYFDLRVRGGANEPRILDVYSHNNGTWISEDIAATLQVPGTDDPSVARTVQRINALDDEGKHADALADLDSLPLVVRDTRPMQRLRVAIAGRISSEAHGQAIMEQARRFSDDKPTPLTSLNRAVGRGDLTEALRQVDVLDAAIGGDPFLDAVRASLLVARQGPDDLAAATARADRAAHAEPTLVMPQLVKVGVAMARRQWSTALSTLDALERNLGVKLSDEQLGAMPNAAGFIGTPEFKTWRKRHP